VPSLWQFRSKQATANSSGGPGGRRECTGRPFPHPHPSTAPGYLKDGPATSFISGSSRLDQDSAHRATPLCCLTSQEDKSRAHRSLPCWAGSWPVGVECVDHVIPNLWEETFKSINGLRPGRIQDCQSTCGRRHSAPEMS
jgi:hypothetical protein